MDALASRLSDALLSQQKRSEVAVSGQRRTIVVDQDQGGNGPDKNVDVIVVPAGYPPPSVRIRRLASGSRVVLRRPVSKVTIEECDGVHDGQHDDEAIYVIVDSTVVTESLEAWRCRCPLVIKLCARGRLQTIQLDMMADVRIECGSVQDFTNDTTTDHKSVAVQWESLPPLSRVVWSDVGRLAIISDDTGTLGLTGNEALLLSKEFQEVDPPVNPREDQFFFGLVVDASPDATSRITFRNELVKRLTEGSFPTTDREADALTDRRTAATLAQQVPSFSRRLEQFAHRRDSPGQGLRSSQDVTLTVDLAKAAPRVLAFCLAVRDAAPLAKEWEAAVEDYLDFLHIVHKCDDSQFAMLREWIETVPSLLVEAVWQSHVLRTQDYVRDQHKFSSRLIHHIIPDVDFGRLRRRHYELVPPLFRERGGIRPILPDSLRFKLSLETTFNRDGDNFAMDAEFLDDLRARLLSSVRRDHPGWLKFLSDAYAAEDRPIIDVFDTPFLLRQVDAYRDMLYFAHLRHQEGHNISQLMLHVTAPMDLMWHSHMLHTERYEHDCSFLGLEGENFLHHLLFENPEQESSVQRSDLQQVLLAWRQTFDSDLHATSLTDYAETVPLPIEILVAIFSDLSSRDVLLGAGLVCRKWHVASLHNSIWEAQFRVNFASHRLYFEYASRLRVEWKSQALVAFRAMVEHDAQPFCRMPCCWPGDPTDDIQTIVIDNGGRSIKVGFAGSEFPRSIFPAVVGRKIMCGVMV